MKNTFGSSVSVTLFGESHGPFVGAVLDGLAPGIQVDEDKIRQKMSLRSAFGKVSTARRESDAIQFVSGVFNGKTTGSPLCILIKNTDVRSNDYTKSRFLARPGHADYTAYCKYHGSEDYRGGGHFSGRLTAPLVAVGAIASAALEEKGIVIGTHVKQCGRLTDRDFSDLQSDLRMLSQKQFAVLDDRIEDEMIRLIEAAAAEKDSVGGILETAVCGLPAGVGEPWFDTVEGLLSHMLFSIPAVKGVEFGAGFGFAVLCGSKANDPYAVQDGKIVTKTNNNGGVNGGITNGMPLVFRTAVKPTPSIGIKQETVDFLQKVDADLEIIGRHDPAVIHRARIVVDSVTALVLCDLLSLRYGTDYFAPSETI